MRYTRRHALALLSSTAALGAAGCTAIGQDGPRFEVVVAGPDGEQPFYDGTDVDQVGPIRSPVQVDGYVLPIQLTEAGTESASEAFRAVGAASAPEEATITMFLDGEQLNTMSVAPSLAMAFARGSFDGQMALSFADREQAESVRDVLTDDE